MGISIQPSYDDVRLHCRATRRQRRDLRWRKTKVGKQHVLKERRRIGWARPTVKASMSISVVLLREIDWKDVAHSDPTPIALNDDVLIDIDDEQIRLYPPAPVAHTPSWRTPNLEAALWQIRQRKHDA